MKTAEETVAHLVDVIGAIYERPQMYADSAQTLDAVIFQYHFMWAYICERLDMMSAHSDLIAEGIEKFGTPDFLFDVRVDEGIASPFLPIIRHWQAVDERIGLFSPPSEQG